eukprot:CAMPEP_0168487866 /NCGR_PEP_ID=MMETSP0228-20121227/67859_1 /TAXON_ID=133427 /ORGANISM="Protoceratium reticulatum, Strain CCCM 535 (=CCMP 1889)" /LENGTH=62 /DNA_ID=CAMNT_0008504501 /DNA_START=8 /DNA_END=193 /DNA_ORIENTATION=+
MRTRSCQEAVNSVGRLPSKPLQEDVLFEDLPDAHALVHRDKLGEEVARPAVGTAGSLAEYGR